MLGFHNLFEFISNFIEINLTNSQNIIKGPSFIIVIIFLIDFNFAYYIENFAN